MAYASASDVSSRTLNLLSGASAFTTTTMPTVMEVNSWLSSGCSIINAKLASLGYSTPAASGTVAYDWLKDLNSLYAAAQAELMRTNVTLAPGERTRGQVYDDMFWKQLGQLDMMDLSQMGISRSSVGSIYVGGISINEKQKFEQDTDRVAPRFARGMFRSPGSLDPTGTTASGNN